MKAIERNSYTQITDKPLAPVGPSDGGRAVSEVDIEKNENDARGNKTDSRYRKRRLRIYARRARGYQRTFG